MCVSDLMQRYVDSLKVSLFDTTTWRETFLLYSYDKTSTAGCAYTGPAGHRKLTGLPVGILQL